MSDVVENAEVEAKAQEEAGKGADPVKTEDKPEYTKAQVEAMIRERLAKEKGKQEEAAKKAREEAETKALAEQGEFKKLHEAAAAKVTELEPFKERAERLEASLSKRWDAEKKDVPDYMLPLLEKMPVDERLDYITDNREKWAKAATNGVGTNPKASTGKQLTSEERQKRQVGMTRFWRGA